MELSDALVPQVLTAQGFAFLDFRGDSLGKLRESALKEVTAFLESAKGSKGSKESVAGHLSFTHKDVLR